ncbi:uncharacterized protein LOC141641653 [Silene latifolia]|uniref:uncharacterized protein LOC141641653 n=1 Tax=Silene latifolia TaxID=37657 RepID=UPI003D77B4EA
MAGAILPWSSTDVKFDIPELNGDNYKVWKERMLLQLGWLDIDYAIRKDEPPKVTKESTKEAIDLYEKWEKSNRLSIMFIKTKMCASIRGSVDQHNKVKDLIKAIDEQFATSDKALASTLIMQFSSLRPTVRDYIMRMRDIAAQLKILEVTMSDSFLLHFILCTLPPKYAPFKISYNTHKDKWSINELMAMCVQEEGRLLMEEREKVNLIVASSSKRQKDHTKNKGKGKISAEPAIKKESTCFFCKKKGHVKIDCIKFKAWLKKKGNFHAFVCYESNMVNVNHNTLWIDSGTTIHVSNTLRGMTNLRKSVGSELSIYSGNQISSHVEAIGTCSLILSSGFILHLEKTFYVPNFSRNLISVSRLVPLGFTFNFSDYGFGILEIRNYWLCCIKGEQTNMSKKGAKRSFSLLEIIHTDICCPDMNANDPKYFITFIDDYSRYMYLYLFRSKDETFDAFKLFKAEVENLCGKRIKIVRSDRGGEYYGKYTENGQAPNPFAKFLQKYGIVAQYTMPDSPDQNGVAERRNRTLIEMTATYILNRVPSKAVSKTPFELFKGWKPSLRHIRIWGCPSEVRVYNPQEKKLDPRTISGYFIGYAEKSKGYRFYCPSHSTRFVESRNAKFFENNLISGSDLIQDSVLERDHHEVPPFDSSDRLVVIHTPQVQSSVTQPVIEIPQNVDQNMVDHNEEEVHHEGEQLPLRISIRERRSAIPDDYEVYLQELDYNVGADNDPMSFSQAVSSTDSNLWMNAMKEEMNSMASNGVWDLAVLSDGVKHIGCK